VIIEFQVVLSRFEELLNNRAVSSRVCVPQAIVFQESTQPPSDDETFYIDEVAFTGCSVGLSEEAEQVALNNVLPAGDVGPPFFGPTMVTRHNLQVTQELELMVASVTELENGNAAGPAARIPVPTTLLLELSMKVSSSGQAMNDIKIVDVLEPVIDDDTRRAQLVSALGKHVNRETTIDLGPLSKLTHGTIPKVINAGIVLTPDQRVVMRLDLDPNEPDLAGFWTSFYDGAIPDRLFGNEWGILVDSSLVTSAVELLVSQALQGVDSFTLQTGPTVAWTPLFGPDLVMIPEATFHGELVDACVGIDMDVDVTLDANFSVPEQNVLRTWGSIDWSGDTGQEILCELLATQFFPIVGAMWIDQGKMNWGEFIGGLALGPGIVMNAIVGYLSTDGPAGQIPPPKDWVKDSDTEYHQDQAFPTNVAGLTGLALDGVIGLEPGLVLLGSFAPPDPWTPARIVTTFSGFGWEDDEPCNTPWDFTAKARIEFTAAPTTTAPGPAFKGVDTCLIIGRNDDLHVYGVPSAPTAFEEIEILFNPGPDAVEAFWNNPYDCEVLIISDGGARLITIPAPKPLNLPQTPEDLLQFEINWLTWRASNCWKESSIWSLIGRFDPEWAVDPGPQNRVFGQLWWVTAWGLPDGDMVSIHAEEGEELASSIVTAGAPARLSVLLPNATVETSVSIVRNGMLLGPEVYAPEAAAVQPPFTTPPPLELSIMQDLLLPVGSIPLAGDFIGMCHGQSHGRLALVVATTSGVVSYVPDGLTLQPATVHRPTGLEGAASARGRLLVWGEEGIADITRFPAETLAAPTCSEPVLDVAAGRDTWFALSHDRIRVYDAGFCPRDEIAITGGRSLAVAGSRLAIATTEGLAIYVLVGEEVGRKGFLPIPGVKRVRGCGFFGPRTAVMVESDSGSGAVVDLASPDRPVEIGRLSSAAWSPQTIRIGPSLFRYVRDAGEIDFFTLAGRSRSSPRLSLSQLAHSVREAEFSRR